MDKLRGLMDVFDVQLTDNTGNERSSNFGIGGVDIGVKPKLSPDIMALGITCNSLFLSNHYEV